jgi:erythromycin esterase-like protein
VLLGEESHGMHDHVAVRTAISRRPIERHGFDTVAIEADAADIAKVDRDPITALTLPLTRGMS